MSDNIYDLIENHYISVDIWKLSYNHDFIDWLLKNAICVTHKSSYGAYIGFVCAVGVTTNVGRCSIVTMLCVHKNHRKSGVVDKMLMELRDKCPDGLVVHTKSASSAKIKKDSLFQTSVYTKPLNPKLLIETGFCIPNNPRLFCKLHSTDNTKVTLDVSSFSSIGSFELNNAFRFFSENPNKPKIHFKPTFSEFKKWFHLPYKSFIVNETSNSTSKLRGLFSILETKISNNRHDIVKCASVVYCINPEICEPYIIKECRVLGCDIISSYNYNFPKFTKSNDELEWYFENLPDDVELKSINDVFLCVL